ncbi:MAG: dicarboxylate/amino acid:cation symporter [Croceibacterium sp.]
MPKSLKRIPLAGWIVIGLVLGAVAGLALPTPGKAAWSDTVVASADVVAKLWLAALQMTILPLVFALLSTTFVRSGGLSASEGVARRTIVVILALYLLAVLVGLVFTPILLALSPVTPEIAAAMRSAGGGPVAVPHLPVADMILGAVPTNIVSAAASGSLLPVLVFALVFGAALARIGSERNAAIVAVLEGLAAAMFLVVGWVIALAPIGVGGFILVATNTGGAALLWGIAHYVALYSALMLILTAFAYVVAVLAGRAPLGAFARAMLPVQIVAFSTRSSLGCLPLGIEAARQVGVRETAADVSMPLTVALMRNSSSTSAVFYGAYGAIVYGLPHGLALLFVAGLIKSLMEIGSVGIPAQATLAATAAPALAVMHIPAEFLALIIVAETVPDMIKTVCNITFDVATATVVDRDRARNPR